MIAQSVELVKYEDGKNDTMRLVVSDYGVEVQHSRNDGESWNCQSVINLEAAIEFAKNLIAFVEQTTQAEEDAAMDRHVEEMYERHYADRADAISMAEDVEFSFWQPAIGYCPELDDAVDSGEQLPF
jgi:hypothetical protein